MVKNYELRPYPIRIPPEMREKLEAAAKSGNRSLHAEIMQRLEESFKRETNTTGAWHAIQIIEQYLEDLKSEVMYLEGFDPEAIDPPKKRIEKDKP